MTEKEYKDLISKKDEYEKILQSIKDIDVRLDYLSSYENEFITGDVSLSLTSPRLRTLYFPKDKVIPLIKQEILDLKFKKQRLCIKLQDL